MILDKSIRFTTKTFFLFKKFSREKMNPGAGPSSTVTVLVI